MNIKCPNCGLQYETPNVQTVKESLQDVKVYIINGRGDFVQDHFNNVFDRSGKKIREIQCSTSISRDEDALTMYIFYTEED